MSFGVTPQGFKAKRLDDIKNDLEDAFIAEFSEINLEAQSVTGQIIGIFSKAIADIWENLENVYESQYVSSASGIALDNVVYLLGITRLPAQRTVVNAVAYGAIGTLIPAGSLARQNVTNEIFFSESDVVISNSNAVQNIVTVNNLAAQPYTVFLNGEQFTYGLPTATFSGPLVSGNSVTMRINGINTPTVNYTTSSANTLSLIAASILTSPDILSAVVVGNTIEITANSGKEAILGPSQVTGPGAPTLTTTYRTPGSTALVAQELALIIDDSPDFMGEILAASTFQIFSVPIFTPYSIIVGTGLIIDSTGSPIRFIAQNFGPVAVPANTLQQIVTPAPGWTDLDNIVAGNTGRFAETDDELRIRRNLSLRLGGAATVEAIRARLLQQVPGVTSVLVFENTTMTQEDILATFDSDFDPTNLIDVRIDTVSQGVVSWQGSQVATIQAVADLIEDNNQVESATVGGITNREILVEVAEGREIELEFFITVGVIPNYTISGGRPPKSFEAVVEGGANQDIGNLLWLIKPAGIQSFGNTQVNVIDSMGQTQAVFFSRAVPIYIWADATITIAMDGSFPVNGLQQVANAILAYGNSLGVGGDVYIQRVQAAIFTVPGVIGATIQLARTTSLSDTPAYSNVDIPIASTEISVWDLSRIIVGF